MAYNIEKVVEAYGGKQKVLDYIFTEGPTQVELHKELRLSSSDKRLNRDVYTRLFNYLGIPGMPYPNLKPEQKKFFLALDKFMPEYWNSSYIVEFLLKRLNSPIFNTAEGKIRTVIAFPRHPKANISSNQIKGHIIAWELYNKQYVPDNHWVIPIDGDYLNLSEDNLTLVNTTKYKSTRFEGVGNPSYKNGGSLRPKLGGWSTISKAVRLEDECCLKCKSSDDLVVHHIINYLLFSNPIDAHQRVNLITLCRSCHTLVHNHKLSIKQDLIAEMRYSKLLELLETLKSQVPDTLMETYKDVEKQLGLTDNQQPST